ncbi:MAG: corrinoid protein [Chloroflexi bacterium]|jgi:5-methyltetrahydrofolate--homocysteine methyltransferase|nr:corrinoid protein [Chloroflexota bacterium]MBT7080453.1 corrinoid protein [Chloroflexota bacterium]MBT7289156.1 corrinoid protein [Chloroflexota bacterium]
MSDYKALQEAVLKGDIKTALEQTQKAIDAKDVARDVLDNGLIPAMDEMGDRFAKGVAFVPQMLRAAKTMQECVKLLQPLFAEGDITSKGKVLIGTVKGDLHDIGKNLVAMMLEGAGFTIVDIGVDVSPDKFVEKVKETNPDIVGMSALLSTTMPAMPETIEALKTAGLRDNIKIMIGGAPVTEKYATQIEADSYASDAGSAVAKAKELLGIS